MPFLLCFDLQMLWFVSGKWKYSFFRLCSSSCFAVQSQLWKCVQRVQFSAGQNQRLGNTSRTSSCRKTTLTSCVRKVLLKGRPSSRWAGWLAHMAWETTLKECPFKGLAWPSKGGRGGKAVQVEEQQAGQEGSHQQTIDAAFTKTRSIHRVFIFLLLISISFSRFLPFEMVDSNKFKALFAILVKRVNMKHSTTYSRQMEQYSAEILGQVKATITKFCTHRLL